MEAIDALEAKQPIYTPVISTNRPCEPEPTSRLWSSLRDVCDVLRIDAPRCETDLRFQHLQFRRRQRIHTIGQPFDMLYIVYGGFVKTVTVDELGHEQVLGFPMRGDILGIEGIHSRQYATEAVALSNCDVILVPFKVFSSLAGTFPELGASLYGTLSRAVENERGTVNLLGSLASEARVARFLARLSDRYAELGYSATRFKLQMTREEIGRHLGVSLETVSRAFSALSLTGLISVKQRYIVVHDMTGLRTLRRLPPSRTRIQTRKQLVAARQKTVYQQHK